MKKYIEINDRTFEVVPHLSVSHDCLKDIFDAYKKPSKYKINIWHSWTKWFNELKENDNDFISICSYNFATFTIHGRIKGYKFYITQKHNYVQLQSLEDVTIK